MNPDVAAYIAQCRARGFSDDAIRVALAEAGWGAEVIALALPENVAAPAVAAPEPAAAAIPEPASSGAPDPHQEMVALQPQAIPVKRSRRWIVVIVCLLLAGGAAAALWFFYWNQTPDVLIQQEPTGDRIVTIETPRQFSKPTPVEDLAGIFGTEKKRMGQVIQRDTTCKTGVIMSSGDAASLRRADGTVGRGVAADGTFTTYTTTNQTSLVSYVNNEGAVCLQTAVLDSSSSPLQLDARSTALAVAAPLGAITTEQEVSYYLNAAKMPEFVTWLSGKLKEGPLAPLVNTTSAKNTPDQAKLADFVSTINQQASEARRKK